MKKLLYGIFVSFEIMLLFIFLQLMVSTASASGIVAAFMITTGAYDQNAIMDKVMQYMSNGSYMIGLTLGATAISAVVSVSFYWAIWGRKKSMQDKQYLSEKVFSGRSVAMISIAALALYFVAVLIAELIAVISPETVERYNEMMDMTLGADTVLAMVAAVLLAPVNEECIMRGLILQNLRKYFPVPAVIAIQAVMFGIFHMNWVQGFYVLPIGAALGYVAIKSRSVLPCIYMHLFYNLASFAMGMLPEALQTVPFCVLAIAICAVVLCILGKESYGKGKVG